MRQSARRGVAPLNTNPKWPEGYVATLREAGAQEKTLPFLVTWVRRFFARFPGRSRRTLGRGEIETFLSEMARRNDISNWQIAQARDALELYYEQFRGIALAPRPDHVLPTTPSPPSAQPSRDQGMTPAVDGQFVATPIVKLMEPYQPPRAPVNAVSRQKGRGASTLMERRSPRPTTLPVESHAIGTSRDRLIELGLYEKASFCHVNSWDHCPGTRIKALPTQLTHYQDRPVS